MAKNKQVLLGFRLAFDNWNFLKNILIGTDNSHKITKI